MSMPSAPGSSSQLEGESRRLEPSLSCQEADNRAQCSAGSPSAIGRRLCGASHACADVCALARGGPRLNRLQPPMLPSVRGWSPAACRPLAARWPTSASASSEIEVQGVQLRCGLLLCRSCWWGGRLVAIIARKAPMAAWPLCQVACASMTSSSCRYGSDVSRQPFNTEVWPDWKEMYCHVELQDA
jgi:hypothetical protein